MQVTHTTECPLISAAMLTLQSLETIENAQLAPGLYLGS